MFILYKNLGSQKIPNTNNDYKVVVDGILGVLSVSVYYILILIALSNKIGGKPIHIMVLCPTTRSRWLPSNFIYRLFLKTDYYVIGADIESDENKKTQSQEIINGLLSAADPKQALIELTVNGIPFGTSLYSGYLRKYLVGTVDINSERFARYMASSLKVFDINRNLIASWKPDLVLLSHSDYVFHGSIFHNALYYKAPTFVSAVALYSASPTVFGRMYTCLEDFWAAERNYVFSVSASTQKQLLEQFGESESIAVTEALKKRIAGNSNSFNASYHKDTRRFESSALRSQLNLGGDFKKIALIACHVLWDDPNSAYKSTYPDYEEWVSALLAIVAVTPSVAWIFKLHPSEFHMGTTRSVSDIISERFQTLPANVRVIKPLDDINTYSLIKMCDVVLTVRGTIGYEAAILGKRVITCGSGPYSGFGISTECLTITDYERTLYGLPNLSPLTIKEQEQLISTASFAYYVNLMRKFAECPPIQHWVKSGTIKKREVYRDPVLNSVVDILLKKEAADLV